MADVHLPHFNKRAHNLDVNLNSPIAFQHAGERGGALLRSGFKTPSPRLMKRDFASN